VGDGGEATSERYRRRDGAGDGVAAGGGARRRTRCRRAACPRRPPAAPLAAAHKRPGAATARSRPLHGHGVHAGGQAPPPRAAASLGHLSTLHFIQTRTRYLAAPLVSFGAANPLRLEGRYPDLSACACPQGAERDAGPRAAGRPRGGCHAAPYGAMRRHAPPCPSRCPRPAAGARPPARLLRSKEVNTGCGASCGSGASGAPGHGRQPVSGRCGGRGRRAPGAGCASLRRARGPPRCRRLTAAPAAAPRRAPTQRGARAAWGPLGRALRGCDPAGHRRRSPRGAPAQRPRRAAARPPARQWRGPNGRPGRFRDLPNARVTRAPTAGGAATCPSPRPRPRGAASPPLGPASRRWRP
jgi:hypothetical protein